MLELQSSLYRELIDRPRCEDCQERPRGCSEPYGLTREGLSVARATGGDLVVSWPDCPRRHEALYRHGVEVLPLDEVLGDAVERGVHRRRHVPAGAAALYRHYLAARDAPSALAAARRRKQRELERAAQAAARGLRRG